MQYICYVNIYFLIVAMANLGFYCHRIFTSIVVAILSSHTRQLLPPSLTTNVHLCRMASLLLFCHVKNSNFFAFFDYSLQFLLPYTLAHLLLQNMAITTNNRCCTFYLFFVLHMMANFHAHSSCIYSKNVIYF